VVEDELGAEDPAEFLAVDEDGDAAAHVADGDTVTGLVPANRVDTYLRLAYSQGMEDTRQVNRFPGSCTTCGTKVPAGAGLWSRATGPQHADGDCKTTTKTYQTHLHAQALRDHQKAVADAYDAAGLTVLWSDRIEHSHNIAPKQTGFLGLRCMVGGYARAAVMPYGVRIFQGDKQVYDGPRPRIETGDYYADRLAEHQEIIAKIMEFTV
jgi:hypothetical protein